MTVHVSDSTFDKDVLHKGGLVLVDLWAEWCAPCRAIAPVLDELDREFGELLTVAKINVDENPLTAQRFGVRSIPTLLLVDNEEVVETLVGTQSKAALTALVNRHLTSTV